MFTSPIVLVRGKGVPSDQQRSLCPRSEQLSAVSTSERVNGADVSHYKCGHLNLTVVWSRDRFDASTRLKEILRNPTLDFSINHIQTLIVQVSEPAPGDARADHLFRHA